jgi:Tfp pilus assembly PilM family ATPase
MPGKRTVLGLDWGRYAVKAVVAERTRAGIQIVRTEQLRLPVGSGNGIPFVTSWMEKSRLQKLPTVISITAQKTLFQPFSMPPDDPRTVAQASGIEVARYTDMASESMVHDAVAVDIANHRRHVLLVMARTSLLDECLRTAREAGLDVVDLVPSAIALYNWVEHGAKAHDTVTLYVNVGASSTEVAVGSAQALFFARGFSIGGHMYSEAIARAVKIAPAQAEERKLAGTDDPALAAACASVNQLWVAELNACLAVYRNLYPDRRLQPARIVVAGGGSALRGFVETVSAAAGLPAERLQSLPGATPGENAGVFATAAGLALSAAGSPRCRVRLLPPNVRDELTFREQKPFWIGSASIAALILGVSVYAGYYDFGRWAAKLGEERALLEHRQRLFDQFDHARRQADAIHGMAGPVGTMVKSGVVVRGLITLIAEAKTQEDWITMISDSVSYYTPPPEPPADGEPVAEMRERRPVRRTPQETPGTSLIKSVIVEGYTRTPNLTTVRDFIARLEESPLVLKADLLRDDRLMPPAKDRKPLGSGIKLFAVEITLRQS